MVSTIRDNLCRQKKNFFENIKNRPDRQSLKKKFSVKIAVKIVSKMNKIVAFAFVAFFASATAGPIVAGYHGTCPDVSFVKDFDFSKFKGMWYAIKETGMQIPCVTYNLEETRANHYHATEMPENLLMEFDKKNADDFTDGFSMKFQVNPFMDNADVKIFHLDGELVGLIEVNIMK